MVAADFEVGDLVWAKMKNYPFWPGKIDNPPKSSTPSKKLQHYVFFFGTENWAWISDENIVHHSEEMLQSTSTKKKSTSLKAAIDKIVRESEKVPMKSRPSVKENHESELCAESSPPSSSERKVSKSHKGKSKYENAKKRYFVKVQKTSQNQYFTKMHKKVRKKYFTDKIKSSRLNDTSSMELNGENLQGLVSTFSGKTIQSTKKKIGFLGLGKIGQKIVKKLLESDHNVTVWNRTLEKCEEFVKLGAHRAFTPASVVAACDVTFCCLSGVDAVKKVVFGPGGVMGGLEGTRGKGFVELSVIDPVNARVIGEAIQHKGGRYLESPVSESKRQNTTESLIVICSGDYELFRMCESCFFAFTSDAYYLSGIVGLGSKMNLLASMFMNTVYAALAESSALIQKLNLSQEALLEFIKQGPLNCYLLQAKGNAIATDDFFSGSALKYLQKDLSLALALGNSCAQPMPLAAAANELYKRPIHLLFEPKNGTSSNSTTED